MCKRLQNFYVEVTLKSMRNPPSGTMIKCSQTGQGMVQWRQNVKARSSCCVLKLCSLKVVSGQCYIMSSWSPESCSASNDFEENPVGIFGIQWYQFKLRVETVPSDESWNTRSSSGEDEDRGIEEEERNRTYVHKIQTIARQNLNEFWGNCVKRYHLFQLNFQTFRDTVFPLKVPPWRKSHLFYRSHFRA